jgi:hypothetical protein
MSQGTYRVQGAARTLQQEPEFGPLPTGIGDAPQLTLSWSRRRHSVQSGRFGDIEGSARLFI